MSRRRVKEILHYWRNGYSVRATLKKFHIGQQTLNAILSEHEAGRDCSENFGFHDMLDLESRTYNFNWIYRNAESV